MILNTDELMQFDTEQFSIAIAELKNEIIANNDSNLDGEDAIILEVIDVLQEEIALRKKKGDKAGLSSDVKFLAYVNFFNTIMDGGFEDEYDESGEYFDEDEEYEDEEEDEDR